jgi:Icc protein
MKIIQISDSHIRDRSEALVYGVNPRQRLSLIIDRILTNESNFDFIVITGDISDDGSIDSYKYVANLLKKINKKIYFINGNHDLKKNLISEFSKFNLFLKIEETLIGNWLFIGLDTCVEGKDFGLLSKDEIQRLNFLVNKAKRLGNNCIIFIHHHPILVGTPLIDDCPLINNKEFISIVEKNSHIKLIMTGHVHNDYSIKIGIDGRIETGISSFAQFKYGGSNELTDIDISKYGYKKYELTDNSYIASCIWIHEKII